MIFFVWFILLVIGRLLIFMCILVNCILYFHVVFCFLFTLYMFVLDICVDSLVDFGIFCVGLFLLFCCCIGLIMSCMNFSLLFLILSFIC